jgi:hypothetical protein
MPSPLARPLRLTAPMRIVLAACSALLLTGCFLSPGTFTAEMDVRQDGSFTFTYDGEIVVLAMSQLAQMANEAEGNADNCVDEDSYETRICSEEELAAKRAEEEQATQMMQAMMGGADLSDPAAAREFATQLERQAGWDKVEYLGDGLFDVEFRIASTLTHDFDFPSIEGMPMRNTFVAATRRDGNRIHIEAPGFSAMGGNPMTAMMGGMAGAFAGMASGEGESEGEQTMPDLPQANGTFRLVTDAMILTNNTDEGPAEGPAGRVLEWKIGPASASAPEALLLLGE